MTIEGINYRLTKHGRQRFLERIGKVSDSEMLVTAVAGLNNFKFIWKPGISDGFRLVTVIVEPG